MLLTCENCKTIFRIEAKTLPQDGQKVRCSVCKHIWLAVPHQLHPEQENKILWETAQRLKMPALLFLLVMFVSAVLFGFRGPITAHFPALISSFNGAGLTISPDLSVLEIRDLQAIYQNKLLRVHGQIYNKDRFTAHAAPLQMQLIGADQNIVTTQRLIPDSRYIPAGGKVGFFVQIEIENAETADVKVDLLPESLFQDLF